MKEDKFCNKNHRPTLCWSCRRACGGCSWTARDPKTHEVRFEPVEGWEAEKNNGARDKQPKAGTQARRLFDLLLRHGKLPRAALPALRAGQAAEGAQRDTKLGSARGK